MLLAGRHFGWMGHFFDFFLAVVLGVVDSLVVVAAVLVVLVVALWVLVAGWVVPGGGGLWTWRVLCVRRCRGLTIH